jgi:hypothetical protein
MLGDGGVSTSTAPGLGRQVKVYGRKPRSRVYVVVSFLASSLFLCSGIFAMTEGDTVGAYLLPVGLAFIALSIYLLSRDLRNRDYVVQLFSEGLVHTKAGTSKTVRWADIEEVYQDISTAHLRYGIQMSWQKHILKLRDQSTLTLTDNLKDIGELGERLQDVMIWKYKVDAQNRLAQGERIEFGPYALTNEGIVLKKQLIEWDRIKKLHVNNQSVVVKASGSMFKVYTARRSKIPNLYVMIELCKERIRSEQPIEYA